MKAFKFHCDAAHGWLEVTIADLQKLGLKPSDFTRYSYVSHSGTLYLEEDCDAPKFIAAYHKVEGHEPATIEQPQPRGESFIRALPSNRSV